MTVCMVWHENFCHCIPLPDMYTLENVASGYSNVMVDIGCVEKAVLV